MPDPLYWRRVVRDRGRHLTVQRLANPGALEAAELQGVLEPGASGLSRAQAQESMAKPAVARADISHARPGTDPSDTGCRSL